MPDPIITGVRDEVSETSHRRILFAARYGRAIVYRIVNGVTYEVHTLDDWCYLAIGNVIYPWVW